jgi:predicted dienelactone hydrolase
MVFSAGLSTATPAGVPLVILYPATAPEKQETLGPYQLEVARDAAPAPGRFPLVLISHGTGGSPLVYRSLARFLARQGFVVGLPEHPGNNRNNDTLAHTVTNLQQRPEHLRTAIDWLYGSEKFSGILRPDCVAIIGHSMGGYTALALAGGEPMSVPYESPDNLPHRLTIKPDPRIKALVLLAPAVAWFREPGALANVRHPILMMTGEKDEYTAPSWHARLVLDGLPAGTSIQHRMIENAGHFAFLTPFPAAMTRPEFPPSQDPPGFDRLRFLEEMNQEILDFIRQELQTDPE